MNYLIQVPAAPGRAEPLHLPEGSASPGEPGVPAPLGCGLQEGKEC